MDQLLKNENIPYGYKFVNGNCGINGKKITLPLYLAMYVDQVGVKNERKC